MELEFKKIKKEKISYPAIAQALSAAPKDLEMLQRVYTAAELKNLNDQYSSTWNANFLTKLLKDAKEKLEAQDQKMVA